MKYLNDKFFGDKGLLTRDFSTSAQVVIISGTLVFLLVFCLSKL